ncbi:MAG: hypothetical protein DRI97_01485 [Bacteroidetes bacterium]|nr:MAG: hypothetical protein DRI97_01485 [Bacteroidota bacterium]
MHSCMKIAFLAFLFVLLPLSCQKSAGLGGTGSISGTITEQFYNDDYSLLIYEKPAVDEEVYIVFGTNEELGNRERTNDLGQFRFKYLYPGNYRVYFISDDSSSVLNMDVEKLYELNLDRGEDYKLGRLEKLSTLDFDEGTAMIKGVVKVIDYVDLSTYPDLVIEKTYYATEQEVYLTYNNHTFYDERIRTQTGGVFEFGGLIPGKYLIFLYSDDVTGESDKVTLEFEVNIDDLEQVVDLGEIVIEKL